MPFQDSFASSPPGCSLTGEVGRLEVGRSKPLVGWPLDRIRPKDHRPLPHQDTRAHWPVSVGFRSLYEPDLRGTPEISWGHHGFGAASGKHHTRHKALLPDQAADEVYRIRRTPRTGLSPVHSASRRFAPSPTPLQSSQSSS